MTVKEIQDKINEAKILEQKLEATFTNHCNSMPMGQCVHCKYYKCIGMTCKTEWLKDNQDLIIE